MAYNPYLQNPYYQPIYPMMQQPVIQPPVQQPVQQQVVQQPPQSNMIWINGIDEAKSYPVAPGNTVILMDNDNPVAYKKSTDISGRSLPLEVFDLVRRDEEPKQEENHQINLDEYLTRKEFDEYRNNVEQRFSEMEYDDTPIPEYVEVKPVRKGRKRNG